MSNTRRRGQNKAHHPPQLQSKTPRDSIGHGPASATTSAPQGLRPEHGNRVNHHSKDTVMTLLLDIENALDTAETSASLVPTLDQLINLSGQYPKDWIRFNNIVDLLVGWYVDQATTPQVRKRISDALSSFSHQWNGAAKFAQELLIIFTKDIDQMLGDNPIPTDIVMTVMSCFNVIAKALVSHALEKMCEIKEIQERAIDMVLKIQGHVSKQPHAAGNNIILTQSQASPQSFYDLQPKALEFFLAQFKGRGLDKNKNLWGETISAARKILNAWQTLLHPAVTQEVVHPKGALMRWRWSLVGKPARLKDILDIILLAVPEANKAQDAKKPIAEPQPEQCKAWISVMLEVDNTLRDLSADNTLSKSVDLDPVLQLSSTVHLDRLKASRLPGKHYAGDCRRTGSSASTLLSNLTFDILLLVSMAQLWPKDTPTLFARFLEIVEKVPDGRLAITLYAMKEISSSGFFFIEDWLQLWNDDSDSSGMDASSLGVVLKTIQVFVLHWRILPGSIKTCMISWMADIFHAAGQFRKTFSGSTAWIGLRQVLSTNLHHFITIAGYDENEMVRASVSMIFERFIGTFGSLNLGPRFMAKISDRAFDVSPAVSGAWKRTLFQSNPFGFAFECYNIHETDITRALKVLVLKSPNSGTFRHFHFTSVLSNFTLDSSSQSEAGDEFEGSQDGDTLQRLFHACQGREIMAKVNAESPTDMIALEQLNTAQNSSLLLSYWSLWEAARYCMLSRLRTPYGGPQQTFDALEKLLNGLLHSEESPAQGTLRLSRLRDFLLLLDRLELHCYNASNGTALGVIPAAPRTSVVFFRTNKKVCDEWFSRVRSRVIEGAKSTGQHEIVIRLGYMLLADQFNALSRGAVGEILPWLDDFERIMVDLVEALIAAGASDAISGLYVWCRRAIKDMTRHSSSSKSKQSRADRSNPYPRYKNASLLEGQAAALSQTSLDWINTAVLRAQFRYEQAAREATVSVSPYVDEDSADASPPAEFLCEQITSSLSDLHDYKQLQIFLDSIPIDTFADQTMLWSDETMMQSLQEFGAENSTESWKDLEEFYSRHSVEQIQDLFTLDQSGVIGQNYLFMSKVYPQAGVSPLDIDRLREQALEIVKPSIEFLMSDGMEHARSIFMDGMMLNTPMAATPKAVKEFIEFFGLVPDEMKMNLLRKDLRQWVRLDAMVNLAKAQALQSDAAFVKQSNEFKFLLSKIARRTECHDFARSIPRTWEGALSPEIQFEEAKAAMARHDYTSALAASGRILHDLGSRTLTLGDAEATAVFQSKIFLKMAKWSRTTKPALSDENVLAFEHILQLEDGAPQSPQARIEAITASCLQKAVDIGTHYRKTWFAFGTHHYKQGWGILDDLGSFRLHHPVAKAANETLKRIFENAGVEQAESHSKATFCVFVKHCASGQPFDETVTYESIRAHAIKIDDGLPEFVLSDIIGAFQELLQRILDAYRLSILGYFKFLQFTSLEYECKQPKSKKTTGEEKPEGISQSAISDEITATLRLLRLLAKHGGQLYDAFHENLVDINVSPWTNIIPQLFARLDHPEGPVQSLIADLLCKIGEQSPQLIVFHCVVGTNSAHNSPVQRRLLIFIGEFLKRSHPELMSQVQHFIRELERVTVLWEEIWYKKLVSGMAELKNTLQDLSTQYQGLEVISGLGTGDKHAVMSDNYQQSVMPILATFESLQDSNRRPESNHERWFVGKFGKRIEAALASLRSPKAWNNLFEGLQLLKEICTDIGKELSGTRILQLSDLSPELASIQSSLIDIPSQSTGITIQSFDQQVVVIPTKTKPKKLTLVGSDGKRYTYLFKGLEDLHLDERVMQLLRISNGMLQRDKESNSRHLSARHYAVVPLSDNSGMIQWVESTVSLYTIIAKWQHRELVCSRWMTDDTTNPPQGPQRATDIYHEKAVAALARAGLPPNHPRRQWPKSILLDVYHEMASETPADLLERELWASSPTPAEWWRKSAMFARSTAVMSMIGYVIGLGDRHLDNILVDFTTGDLVHIDYNVCFEKGKRLRIPEVVPFRLTRNILTSFGVTGVEGNFRISCEQTMKVMRKNKEILVTLLEAFVYDPLVDWQMEAPTMADPAGHVLQQQQQQQQHHHHLAHQPQIPSQAPSLGLGLGLDTSGFESQGSSVSVHRESRFGDASSVRSVQSLRRRLSDESLYSNSSVSLKSTSTVLTVNTSHTTSTMAADAHNRGGGDQVEGGDGDATPVSLFNGGGGFRLQHQQQQQQQQQQQHQQRNAYAVNILRRVRHKLEGRDFDPVKKCKVTEQVDRVLQEATHVENLANMYEGWTSWI